MVARWDVTAGTAGGGVAVRRGDERVEILRRSCSDRLRMTVLGLVVSYRELKPARSRRKNKAAECRHSPKRPAAAGRQGGRGRRGTPR